MRDFRDAKVMARALRDALKAQAIETTHAEALELIAKAFGCKSWNILSAKIEAAEPKPSDERLLSAGGDAGPPKRRTEARDRHGERADPSQITRLAVKDIGYERRSFHWEKASIKVYLHGQSVDIAQGVVSTGNKGAGDPGIMLGRGYRETPELHRVLNYSHRLLKETRALRHNGFGKVVGGTLTMTTTLLGLTDAGRATLRALLRDL
jgi:Glyoxalase superfamily protein